MAKDVNKEKHEARRAEESRQYNHRYGLFRKKMQTETDRKKNGPAIRPEDSDLSLDG